MQVRRTVRDLRRHNRSVLLSSLYLGEPQSRQDLGRSSGLSQGTVSNVVGELIEEGLVVEAGLVDSDGGRPRTLLRVNPGHTHVVGVDVGETGTRVEVFDLAMRPLATSYHPLPSARPDPAAVVAQIHEGLGEVLREAAVPTDDVLGIGVGVFGTVEQGREATVHAQTIGWEAVPLERMLRAGTALPIYLENGAKTLGQAELWFGAGRGVQHAVITLVGSGVGAAVISNGTISRGVTSSAGEWGHTCIVFDGRACRCGSRGCLEAYVGAEAVLDRWKAARGGRPVPGADEQTSLAELLADGGQGGRAGAGRDRRLSRRRAGQPGQPVQPGADRAGRLGRTGARRAAAATDHGRGGGTGAAPPVRADEHPARAARGGRGRARRGHAAGRGPAGPRRGTGPPPGPPRRSRVSKGVSPDHLAAPATPSRRPAGNRRVDRYNPGIGRPLRLAGRRLDAVGIHRRPGDTPC